MEFLNKVVKFFNSITKRDIIFAIIIVLLIGCLSTSISRCSDLKMEYKNNIAALHDTIRYYVDANGNLVATKLAFESDIKTLKLLNEELYDEIKNLKAKGNITSGTYFTGVIDYGKNDTTYVVEHDTISKGFLHDFAFNNEYRTLEGNVKYQNDTVGVKILKDEINFDYTVAMDDKNNIYITSSNPYVKYNQITGFQLPKEKTKHWSLDAFGNINYSPIDNNRFYNLGLLASYSIKRFSIGPQIYFEHNLMTKDKTFYIGGRLNFNLLKW